MSMASVLQCNCSPLSADDESRAAGVMLALFRELFPEDTNPPQQDCFNWLKLWLGFYLTNAILPCCMLYTYLSPWVEWGGIWYAKSKGKVQRLPSAYSPRH